MSGERSVYVVSYDLSGTGGQIVGLSYELTRTDGARDWWHFLTGTWLIATPETPGQLWERLRPHVRERDRLLIVRAGPDYAGSLPDHAWGWMRERMAEVAS